MDPTEKLSLKNRSNMSEEVIDLTVSDDDNDDDNDDDDIVVGNNKRKAAVFNDESESTVRTKGAGRLKSDANRNRNSDEQSYGGSSLTTDCDPISAGARAGAGSGAGAGISLHMNNFQIDQRDGNDNGILSANIHLPPSQSYSHVDLHLHLSLSMQSQSFNSGTRSHILSCSGIACASASASASTSTSSAGSTNHALLHMQQLDKWSCGFRNFQMLLGSIIPIMPPSHPFLLARAHAHAHAHATNTNTSTSTSNISTRTILIPSTMQIQIAMEQGWKEGFDSKGAEFFRNKIRGKKSKIGAVETSSLLSYWHIDSCIVQFIVCQESRGLLGEFVWKYFEVHEGSGTVTGTGNIGDDCRRSRNCDICSALGTRGLVDDIMAAIEFGGHPSTSITSNIDIDTCSAKSVRSNASSTNMNTNTNTNTKRNAIPHPSIRPLYLQWEGHSVTIIGIERSICSSGSGSGSLHKNYTYNLLVFDPMKHWNYDNCGKDGKWNYKHMKSIRLSTTTTMKKDCQVIVASSGILGADERERRRQSESAGVVTAASQKVMEFIQRSNAKY